MWVVWRRGGEAHGCPRRWPGAPGGGSGGLARLAAAEAVFPGATWAAKTPEEVGLDAPPDVYGAFGHGGQRAMVVIPSRGIVLRWNDTHGKSREAENETLLLIGQAAEGKL